MLTVFDDEASTLNGFACGGDDYVTKPFSGRILLARIEALLRRSGAAATLRSGELVFDLSRHLVTRAGAKVHLLPTEYSLAELLIRQRGALVTRQTLLGRLWDDRNLFVEKNTLTVNISRLRKKLGSWQGQPDAVSAALQTPPAQLRALGRQFLQGQGYASSGLGLLMLHSGMWLVPVLALCLLVGQMGSSCQ